jgi:hypothetical protein
MKATALFMAASALAAVSAGAYDGYGYDPRPASSYNDTISGAAHIGYDSRYAYKDVVASSLLNRSGVFNIGGELNLNLARDWKQEIGAEYMAFCDGLLSDKDAFDANWKAVKELFPNLSFRAAPEKKERLRGPARRKGPRRLPFKSGKRLPRPRGCGSPQSCSCRCSGGFRNGCFRPSPAG